MKAQIIKSVLSLTLALIMICQSTLSLAASSTGVLGELYSSGHPATGERGNIIDMTSWKHFLYVSWRDLDGDHHLDVWNVRDPRQASLIDQIPYGNLLDDQDELIPVAHLKAPRDMTVQDGHLLFWSSNNLFVYKLRGNGRPQFIKREDFKDRLNRQGLSRLSYGGTFATTQRTMMGNREFVDLLVNNGREFAEEQLQENVFLNLTNPTKPFLMEKVRDHGAAFFAENNNVNATWNGQPAILNIDEDNFTLNARTYAHSMEHHIVDFWQSKTEYIFNIDIFDTNIDDLINEILDQFNYGTLHVQMMTDFMASLDVDKRISMRDLILSNHDADIDLVTVLEDYDINFNDRVDVALQKIIEAHIDAEFEAELSAEFFAKVMASWKRKIFRFDDLPIAELQEGFKAAMDFEIDSTDAREYFVERIIGPLLGNPDYIKWTLEDLILEITDTEAGATIDDTLDGISMTIDGIHAIIGGSFWPVAQLIDWAADAAGVDADIDLDNLNAPACFQFPDSAAGFLEIILYEHGANLNADGYAFFELIKLAGYFAGDEGYLDFIDDLEVHLDDLHLDLSENVFASLFGQFDPSLLGEIELEEFIKDYSKSLSLKKALSKSLSKSLERTLQASGIATDISIKEALHSLEMYVDILDLPRGEALVSVEDFVVKLEALALAQHTLEDVFEIATSGIDINPLKASFKIVLTDLFMNIFGEVSLEASFEALITNYISDQVDGGQIFGEFISDIMGNVLRDTFSNITISTWIDKIDRAADGDCIAQWQVTIETISAVLTVIENWDFTTITADVNILSIVLDELIDIAYDTAIDFVVKTMVRGLVQGIFTVHGGGYATWYNKMELTEFNVDLAAHASFQPRFTDGFAYQERMSFVMSNVGFLGPANIQDQSDRVALLQFDPRDVDATAEEIDLGEWNTFYSRLQADEFLLVGGTQMKNGRRANTVKIINLTEADVQTEISGRHVIGLSLAEKMVTVNGGETLAIHTQDQKVIFIEAPRSFENDLEVSQREAQDNSPRGNEDRNDNNYSDDEPIQDRESQEEDSQDNTDNDGEAENNGETSSSTAEAILAAGCSMNTTPQGGMTQLFIMMGLLGVLLALRRKV